jgi:hypothetical protein
VVENRLQEFVATPQTNARTSRPIDAKFESVMANSGEKPLQQYQLCRASK